MEINSIEEFNDAIDGLSNDAPNLSSLSFGLSFKLSISQLEALAKALENNTTLKDLDLSFQNLGTEGAAILFTSITSNLGLRNIKFGMNQIGDEGAYIIAAYLRTNPFLTELHIPYNLINTLGLTAIEFAVKCNTNLTRIITSYEITEDGCTLNTSPLAMRNHARNNQNQKQHPTQIAYSPALPANLSKQPSSVDIQ